MARRNYQALVQAMNLYNSLDDRDKATLGDYIRSQQPPRKKAAKSSSKKSPQPATTGNSGLEEGATQ